MKKKNTVFLPIETKVREFESKVLLSSFLLNEGFDIVIGARGAIQRELNYGKGGLLIYKSISSVLFDKFEKYRKNGTKIIIVDEEGTVFFSNEEETVKSRVPSESFKYLDDFYVSGERIKELITNYYEHTKELSIYVTGNPRFDLLKPKYRELYEDIIKERAILYGKYILINTTFGSGNPFDGWDTQKERICNNADFTNEVRNVLLDKMEWDKMNIQSYIDAVKQLSKEFPDYSIIIRPHPSENLNGYSKELSSYKKVFIVREGNVYPWIFGASVIIHYDCTTGVEAKIASRPVISFTPNYNQNLAAWLPISISDYRANNVDELIFHITNVIDGNATDFSLDSNKIKILNEYILNISDNEATLTIVKAIMENSNNYEYFVLSSIKLFYKRIYDSMRKLKKNLLSVKSAYYSRFEGITKHETKLMIDKLIAINKLNVKCTVSRYGSDAIIIKEKI
ncbi:MAG: hypothetical protein K9J13_04345 [Saprospiraceae bacterium]|nr:hypothetical protein [Saprospiraceae bacterium]